MVDKIEGMVPATEAVSDFQDIKMIWLVQPENKEKTADLIRNLEDYSLWTVESSDLMDFGPLGLYLFDNQDIEDNPYGGFDEEEGTEIFTKYRFGVLDSSLIGFEEMKEEKGFMLCVLKNADKESGVLVRLPINQIAKINPIEVESVAGMGEYLVEIKNSNEQRPKEGIEDINKFDLESARKIYGMWKYVAEHGSLPEFEAGMSEIYGEIPVSSDSLRSIEEFLNNENNWENTGVGLTEWCADRVFSAMGEMISKYDGDFNAPVDRVLVDEEITVLDKICDLSVIISEKVDDDLLYWRILIPVLIELEKKGVTKKDFLNKLAGSGLALINFFDIPEVSELMQD